MSPIWWKIDSEYFNFFIGGLCKLHNYYFVWNLVIIKYATPYLLLIFTENVINLIYTWNALTLTLHDNHLDFFLLNKSSTFKLKFAQKLVICTSISVNENEISENLILHEMHATLGGLTWHMKFSSHFKSNSDLLKINHNALLFLSIKIWWVKIKLSFGD